MREAVFGASQAMGEHNDCVLIAFALTTGIPYEETHEIFRKGGRRRRCGTPWRITQRIMRGRTIDSHVYRRGRPTVERFIREHPKGAYIVCTRDHAIAVIDGHTDDIIAIGRPRSFVTRYFKVKPQDLAPGRV